MNPRNFLRRGVVLTLLLGVLCVVAPQALLANEMDSIRIEVALQADGSGIVRETRDMTLNEGTEIYIPMNDNEGSEIVAFSVSENGVPFTDVGDWDVNRSRAEKAGQYGINRVSGGVELCWGIGDYGRHIYEVEYHITNMVRQLTDGQSMYWKLFNEGTNMPPKDVQLYVHGPVPMDAENTKIWGFGFPGEIVFQEGAVAGRSTQALGKSHRVILLVQFMESPFQAAVPLNMTLADQEAQAKEGSSYGSNDGSTGGSGGGGFIDAIGALIFPLLIPLLFIGRMFARRGKSSGGQKTTSRELVGRNKDKYHRDVPYTNGPMTDVANFLQKMGTGDLEAYFNAYLLKWMKDGHIDHTTERGGFFNRESSVMQLNRGRIPGDDLESRLWNLMQAAAGADNRLDENEFSRWAKKEYRRIDDWVDDLKAESEASMTAQGYLTAQRKKAFGMIPYTTVDRSPAGEQLADRLVQFRNYLQDYSLLNEREASHVGLWDNLLIWAALYGIADEVAKQFEKLDPEYMQQSSYSYSDLYMMSLFSNSFAGGYSSGLSSAASSGGGGFTSIGGGGGSFGGGFGGGSR